MLDVETSPDGKGEIVLRCADKVLVGAKASVSADPSNAKEHKPALVWSDESGQSRRFVLATGDNPEGDNLKAICDDVIAFYLNAPERKSASKGSSEAEREEVRKANEQSGRDYLATAAMGDEALTILTALIPSFGILRNDSTFYGSLAELNAKESERAKRQAEREEKAQKRADADALRAALAEKDRAIEALKAQIAALGTGAGQTSPLIDAEALNGLLAKIGA